MLAITLVEEIERLLQEGTLSQRKIARRLNVSRGTVAAIASGRRGLFGRGDEADDHDPHVHRGAAERCEICGFFVYMPCLVCRTREHRHWKKVWRTFGRTPTSATIQSRSRTNAVRRRRDRGSRRARVA